MKPPDISLAALIENPAGIADLEPAALPPLLLQLAAIQQAIAAHLLTLQGKDRQLIPIRDAARRLGVTIDYLYRHADEYPFTRRLGRKQLRFEAAGLDAWLASREAA